MSYLTTVPESDADDDLIAIYASAEQAMGYVPNYTRTFSHRPGLYRAWTNLIKDISSVMAPRRYELATMGAAITLRSSYCSLAHGEKLLGLGSTEEEVRSLVAPGFGGDLSGEEAAVVRYAAKVASDASSLTQSDVDELRSHGLSDTEIFDVAAAAAARSFFSKMLDATGTPPDPVFKEKIPGLVDVLSVGRRIEPE
jgi:uncharacterized peroxidase-related enzyme